MDLNRFTVEEPSALPGAAPSKKSFEVGDDDFFWEANGRAPFPAVAAESDKELSRYKQVSFLPFALQAVMADTQGKNESVLSEPVLRSAATEQADLEVYMGQVHLHLLHGSLATRDLCMSPKMDGHRVKKGRNSVYSG